MKTRRVIQCATLLILGTGVGSAVDAQTIAITNGTVFPVSGPRLQNATVLIQDGVITAIGTNVTIPAGATRVNASGKWVTPGLINASTQIGLVEISAVTGTREGSFAGDGVPASFNVLEGINPASQLIPVARVAGVTTVLSRPSGGLIAGQAVVIDLAGEDIEAMVVASPAAMVAALNEGAKEAGGGSRAGSMARLRRLLEDAQEFDARRGDYQRAEMQELSASARDLDALLPVVRHELPLLVTARRRSDIENALRLARDFDLDLLIWGGEEAWQIADRLAAADVPVFVSQSNNIPSYDAPSARFENASILSAAGVPVVVTIGGGSHDARNLRHAAGRAVAHGMDWDAALRAITLEPAAALKIDDRYGSLEAGKVANVVVWSGDPFEFSTGVEAVYIRGVSVPLTSRQRELFERYRTLPPRYE